MADQDTVTEKRLREFVLKEFETREEIYRKRVSLLVCGFVLALIILALLFVYLRPHTSESWVLMPGPLVTLLLGGASIALWFYFLDSNRYSQIQFFPLLRYLAAVALGGILMECLGLYWLILRPETKTAGKQWLWQAFGASNPAPAWETFWLALTPILLLTMLMLVLIKGLLEIVREE